MLNCKRCGQDKPLTEMVKKSAVKGGYLKLCRACRSEIRYENGEYMREIVRRHAKDANQKVPLVTENDLIELMAERQTCPYCDVKLTQANRTIDHIYPKSQKYGGKNITDNMIYCCHSCNSGKHTTNIYDFYQRSKKFTDQLWREFIQCWIGRIANRVLTESEIDFMSEQLKAESEELALAKKNEPTTT